MHEAYSVSVHNLITIPNHSKLYNHINHIGKCVCITTYLLVICSMHSIQFVLPLAVPIAAWSSLLLYTGISPDHVKWFVKLSLYLLQNMRCYELQPCCHLLSAPAVCCRKGTVIQLNDQSPPYKRIAFKTHNRGLLNGFSRNYFQSV